MTTNLQSGVMADSSEGQKMDHLAKLHKIIKKNNCVIEDGTPTRYCLKPDTNSHDKFQHYRKLTFGERDKSKPHKTVLMVGETGTGKTTMINVMINYMLGVQRKDKVWFEITDEQSDRTSVHSQTSITTIYGFYLQERKTDFTVIDTPGYGNTCEIDPNKEISMSLLSLIQSTEGIHEIHAVCLVLKAVQKRLHDSQRHMFNAIQSLFGKDIVENIVLLLTYSRGAQPKEILKATEEVKLKCAVNKKNQPVFFRFDNCQREPYDEDNNEAMEMLEQSWSLSFTGMTKFNKFLDDIKPKPLQITQDVLTKWKELEENILKIKSHDEKIEQKKKELKQAKEALEQNKKHLNHEEEVAVTYNKEADTGYAVEKGILFCNKCKKICHSEVRSWGFTNILASGPKNDVCKCKCPHEDHEKGSLVFISENRNEKKVNEDLKKDYHDKIRNIESLIKKLKEELQELEKGEIKRVFDAFYCVETLQKTMLNPDSLITFPCVDFLIEKLKEINESEKVKTLENPKGEGAEKKNTENTEFEKICEPENDESDF